MTDLTQLLAQIDAGDAQAAERLLPLLYDELRKLAAAKLAHEKPGQTLQATALVHEAYLRLLGGGQEPTWQNRAHFFAAAAEAMRRILVDAARRKLTHKHGGDLERRDCELNDLAGPVPPAELLAVHEALDRLQAANAPAAELVKLRYFGGLTIPEIAAHLGVSPRKADQIWSYARAWLADDLAEREGGG